jgi:hypothetical protein
MESSAPWQNSSQLAVARSGIEEVYLESSINYQFIQTAYAYATRVVTLVIPTVAVLIA